VEEIDLNGDKELEYIAVGSTEDTSDDGKIMSKVVLYNKDYKAIETLASWDATEDLKYLPDEVVSSPHTVLDMAIPTTTSISR
jgi:mannose/fructose/N-acetylgalactosamine-specific phosphotransferase system component IIB